MDKQSLPRFPISCEVDGVVHRGIYWIAGKILTVSVASGKGGKSRQVGAMEPAILAKQLLLELVKAGNA